MTSTRTNSDTDCVHFTEAALAWFREGDELADKTYGDHIEYYSKSHGLRQRLGGKSVAVGSLILGVLLLGWLVA